MIKFLRPKAEIPHAARAITAILGFTIVLLAWNLLSAHYAATGKAILFPSPAAVGSAALDYFGHGAESRAGLATVMADVRISFFRVTTAFLLAALVGIPLGVLIGSFRLAESLLQPLTEFVRYVPVPALIPLLIVLFGIDETPKIMLIFIGTVFQLILMVSDEIRRVSHELLNVCYTLGGTVTEAVTKVMLPAAIPGIFDALRLCNGWAWTWLIVAELVAANEGLGFRIIKYQRFLQTDKIFVYLILLGLIGLALDLAFRLLGAALFRWSEAAKR